MSDINQQIDQIEKEIRETPYHKGTQHHIGRLRARIAKLKDRIIETQTKKGGSGGGFAIKKHGDATVVLVGFPSVGKSTLLNALTNAKSPVSNYDFTTVSVIPGVMRYKGARIQILDVPGLLEGASSGKGRGREVLSVVRGADLLLIMAKKGNKEEFDRINKELYLNGVRINTARPNISIIKTLKGGLKVNSAHGLAKQLVASIAQEFGLINADITIREILDIEHLIDAFSKNRVYTKALYITTMMDSPGGDSIPPRGWTGYDTSGNLTNAKYEIIKISAKTGLGLKTLKKSIWKKLELVRIYLKKIDGNVDYEEPMIMQHGETLSDVLRKIGNQFSRNKHSVKIWGPGSRFPGQEVSLHTKIQDQMEVLFI